MIIINILLNVVLVFLHDCQAYIYIVSCIVTLYKWLGLEFTELSCCRVEYIFAVNIKSNQLLV